GTTTPLYKLEVNGSAKVSSLNINGAYSLPAAAGTTSEYLRGDGTWAAIAAGMSGTGTTNYLSKFTGASSIGNSLLFDNGTAVGIGTETLAGARFKVALSSTYSNITDPYTDETKIASIGGGEVTGGKLQAGHPACGTTYATALDADGNSYNSVLVNDQCWMAANLKVGTRIARSVSQIDNSVIEKYCYADADENCTTDGGLYQWDEAMQYSTTEGAQGICPVGWHIPTDTQQYALENYLKDDGQTCDASRYGVWDCSSAGTKLKSGGTSGMNFPLAGNRDFGNSLFYNRTTDAYVWSSSQIDTSAWARYLNSAYAAVRRGTDYKSYGFSVRCLKDATSFTSYASSTTTSTNLLSGSPAFSINNFHYNIATLPATSSIRIQFSKDNTNWYSAAGTFSAWTTISTIGGADIDLADFVTASSWTNGNAFYYKVEINSTTDGTQAPTIDDIRLDYVPLSGSGGLVFDNSGNFGVGTFSPTAKLSIASGGISTGLLADFSNGNAESVFTILDNGSIGIGTTSPTEKLMVAGNVAPSADDTYDLGSATNRWRDLYLGPASLHIAGNTLSNVAGSLTWNGQGVINSSGAATFNGANIGGGALYVDSVSSNIGIGTTSPVYKLEVNGSAKVASLNINGAYSLPTAAGTTSQYLRGDGTWASVTAGVSGSGTLNYLPKFTGASSVGNSLLFDDGTNVGIGTSSPQAGLHVATSNIILGSGYGGTPSDVYIKGPAAGGTNVTGSNMYFDASAGTGTAASGSLIFRSAIGLLSTTLTYDNSSTGNAGWASSLTFAHTVTTDSAKVDKLLVVAISDRVSVTGVTYGGTSMHSLGSYSDVVNVRMWYLKDSELPTGANNVVISSSTSGQISAVAATYYNADQTTDTFGTVAGATAQFTGNISINVSSATNDMVMDVVGTADSGGYSATTPGAGQTAIARVLSNGDNGIATSREAGATTVTMSWSNSTSSPYRQAMMGVSIRAKRIDMGNALTERLRISPAGNIGIGTATPTALLTVYNGTTTGTYTTSGWASSSDARLKTNIVDVTNPLDKIKALSGVYFNWNANPNSDRQIGLIAQDTLKVLPEVVVGNERDGYGIAYGNLSALLIEGVKDQQTQLSGLSTLANTLQNSNNSQDNELQKLNQALALLTTATNDQATITNQKINSIQTNLVASGSQINLLSTKLNSANALLSQNSQPTQELSFYQFKNTSSELSSSLTEQVIENNQFSATYNSPNNFQELAINLGDSSQLDLSAKDQSQSYLVYDVYFEDSAKLEDFHTELGNIQDQKELEWSRSGHPFFLSGWNEVRLSLSDGARTGEIDFQRVNYFRAYFKLANNTNLKFKNIRIETKASYIPLAQAVDTKNLDLLNNIDQGTALKDIFGKLELQVLTNEKLDNQVSELGKNLKKLQDQLDLVQTQSQAVIDFALALNMNNLIYKDVNGNVNLGLGSLEATEVKAKKVQAEDYVVSENTDPLKNNVGSVIIRVGQQEVLVENENVMYDSKIIVTPVGSSPVNWVISDKMDNVGFKIKLDKPAQFDIAFDYWVIGVEK
ncbi:MAG: FISUMP domain-containing protein, partial [Candidatus Moraniibacteriota bacterium]